MSSQSANQAMWLRYTNPDGSQGGLVSTAASIGEQVYIADSAVVIPGAHVPDRTKIGHGEIYSPVGPLKFSK